VKAKRKTATASAAREEEEGETETPHASASATTVDVPSLRVTELKAELKARGASTAGNKAALAARLESVVESESE
jgi:hypothetical protein